MFKKRIALSDTQIEVLEDMSNATQSLIMLQYFSDYLLAEALRKGKKQRTITEDHFKDFHKRILRELDPESWAQKISCLRQEFVEAFKSEAAAIENRKPEGELPA